MEYLRVGVAVFIGIGLFVGWCLRPRSWTLNDVPPERAMEEAKTSLFMHGGAIVMILGLALAASGGLVDRETLLAHGDRPGYVMTAWSFATFYLLLVLERVLLGPDPPPGR